MKIFVTGPKIIDKCKIIQDINELCHNKYRISKRFSTDINDTDKTYIENAILNQGYKNNSFLFICQNKETYQFEGITMDEFYFADILPLELKEFNNITESVLENNESIVIWLDTKKKVNKIQSKNDIIETKFLIDRINYAKLKYLYFCDKDSKQIYDVLEEYLNTEDPKQQKILLEKYQ